MYDIKFQNNYPAATFVQHRRIAFPLRPTNHAAVYILFLIVMGGLLWRSAVVQDAVEVVYVRGWFEEGGDLWWKYNGVWWRYHEELREWYHYRQLLGWWDEVESFPDVAPSQWLEAERSTALWALRLFFFSGLLMQLVRCEFDLQAAIAWQCILAPACVGIR